MSLNLQTLSLPSAEALARQTPGTVDISSKVEGMATAEMRRHLRLKEKVKEPMPKVLTENDSPITVDDVRASANPYVGPADAELTERAKVVAAKEATGALQIMQDGDIELGQFNFSLGGIPNG